MPAKNLDPAVLRPEIRATAPTTAGRDSLTRLNVDRCADVIANTTVFVLSDEWRCIESIRFDGVPTEGGGCYGQARFRTLPLPAAAKEDEFYEFVHVPLRNLTSPALPNPIAGCVPSA